MHIPYTSAHLGSTFIFVRFEVIMKRRQFFSDDEMSGFFSTVPTVSRCG